MKDNINHPDHYISDNGLETIDVIEAWTKDLEGIDAVCTGNAIKYISRWNKKNGVEDLKKAKWYIERLIAHKETEETIKPIYDDMLAKARLFAPYDVEQFKKDQDAIRVCIKDILDEHKKQTGEGDIFSTVKHTVPTTKTINILRHPERSHMMELDEKKKIASILGKWARGKVVLIFRDADSESGELEWYHFLSMLQIFGYSPSYFIWGGDYYGSALAFNPFLDIKKLGYEFGVIISETPGDTPDVPYVMNIIKPKRNWLSNMSVSIKNSDSTTTEVPAYLMTHYDIMTTQKYTKKTLWFEVSEIKEEET